jgi:Na+/H+ antiporter NhaD/arsenite permease-like protein
LCTKLLVIKRKGKGIFEKSKVLAGVSQAVFSFFVNIFVFIGDFKRAGEISLMAGCISDVYFRLEKWKMV